LIKLSLKLITIYLGFKIFIIISTLANRLFII